MLLLIRFELFAGQCCALGENPVEIYRNERNLQEGFAYCWGIFHYIRLIWLCLLICSYRVQITDSVNSCPPRSAAFNGDHGPGLLIALKIFPLILFPGTIVETEERENPVPLSGS